MVHHFLLPYLLLAMVVCDVSLRNTVGADEFVYSGFSGSDLKLDGRASITDHVIMLTDGSPYSSGHAFYNKPLNLGNESAIASFSTTFVFAIASNSARKLCSHGMTFMLSPTKPKLYNEHSDLPDKYLGLLKTDSSNSSSNETFLAVELDTVLNPELNDINGNHVGIDANSLISANSCAAGFYDSNSDFHSLELTSGENMQVWVDYDAKFHQINVTLARLSDKPQQPLLSSTINISLMLSSSVYAGFSAATGHTNCNHSVLGWSFKVNGKAKPLGPLPQFPVMQMNRKTNLSWLKDPMAHEIWEIKCELPTFMYKDLLIATDRFNNSMLLGKGGFGKVYKGILAVSKQNIAIKRISQESKQGMKEFMAEIAILGSLRHRNLVQLLGYCHHRQELLLVYDYMPNGSLDTYLHNQDKPTLNWAQRLGILKGVGSALLYLHEDWEHVVIHRDIKASNVLLDSEMNGRLGDFGLARLHNHGVDAHTTLVAGTWGYIAPELARLGKATKATDVYAFGIFIMKATN
uniref:non-specific serine/threonine protein kinase n=1 Tax=Leersia perrieri TaxID=77586 RepID=A0A0D9XZG3_9ORYZ